MADGLEQKRKSKKLRIIAASMMYAGGVLIILIAMIYGYVENIYLAGLWCFISGSYIFVFLTGVSWEGDGIWARVHNYIDGVWADIKKDIDGYRSEVDSKSESIRDDLQGEVSKISGELKADLEVAKGEIETAVVSSIDAKVADIEARALQALFSEEGEQRLASVVFKALLVTETPIVNEAGTQTGVAHHSLLIGNSAKLALNEYLAGPLSEFLETTIKSINVKLQRYGEESVKVVTAAVGDLMAYLGFDPSQIEEGNQKYEALVNEKYKLLKAQKDPTAYVLEEVIGEDENGKLKIKGGALRQMITRMAQDGNNGDFLGQRGQQQQAGGGYLPGR